MAFSFTDEQQAFREVVQRFLADKSPPTEVRRLMATESGYDEGVWLAMADELGITGLTVPEAFGGQGFGPVELGIVVEEMGRALLCAPFFSASVMAASAIRHAASAGQQERLLPDVAAGINRATVAAQEADGHWDPAAVAMVAERTADGFRLNGSKHFVLDGMSATRLLVAARAAGSAGADGINLFLVDADSDGVKRRVLNVIDPTRKLAAVEFHDVAAERLGDEGNGYSALRAMLTDATVALANESAGGAQAMLDMAVDYTQMRVQFGRLIASFQAIKHQCAELLLEVELAKSSAYYAAEALAEGHEDALASASLAKASASDTFMRAAKTCIQLHGGIGFTWEQDTHLWYKRAKSSEVFLGTPDYHRELMLQAWPEEEVA
ncbi:MAG: acyl-CoA dehydrogenase [Gammaproteobacteria bacterium]|nr:acyl-CoA dehydrogenase [Gammaproteobacteria bacterium]